MDERRRQDESLRELGGWLTTSRKRIEGQVTVRRSRRGRRPETTVSIDHRFPCELDAFAGWHIRTKPSFLPLDHFASETRARIKGAEQAQRGRTLYCHDLERNEATAVASYHLDVRTHLPLLLTMLGLREDSEENPRLRELTLTGALVLKFHLHAIAEATGRGGHVDIDLADKRRLEFLQRLGFRKARRLRGFRPAGTHLRQPAPR
jgi:hypothetical protein